METHFSHFHLSYDLAARSRQGSSVERMGAAETAAFELIRSRSWHITVMEVHPARTRRVKSAAQAVQAPPTLLPLNIFKPYCNLEML